MPPFPRPNLGQQPRKNINNNNIKEKSPEKVEKKKAVVVAPPSKFYKMAADVTAPRLRGCTYIQTECKCYE